MDPTSSDCEKRPLGYDATRPLKRSSSLAKWKAVCLVILTYVVWKHFQIATSSTCPHKASRLYAGEHIHWKPCGSINDRALECSSIDVPIDQFNASTGNETFHLPLIRLRGSDEAKNLLLNPGGPGGSGVNLVYRRGEQLSKILGDGFHLVSFDPRGVNSSKPNAACYPDADTRRRLSSVHDTDLTADSPEIFAWTHNFVRACSDNMEKHGKFVNTPQTAADMNSILHALGQQDMYYWGFSYGTILGQTYATLFPERSHRVIIDGVADQFDWYEKRVDREGLVDTDNVLNGLFKECVKAGDNCTMSSLATSWEDLRGQFDSFMDGLKAQPLSVYINATTYGLLDYKKIWWGAMFPVLYKPQNWYGFADRVGKLMQGNATEAFLEYGQDDDSGEGDESFYTISHNDGASGPDSWPQDKQSLLDILYPSFNDSIFAGDDDKFYFAKQQWKIPKTHHYVPERRVKTKHPLLILSTTYDPVCPLISAKGARDTFDGSRLVEVKGYGHCSVSVPSLCLAKHVRNFLYEGKLPENDEQCEVDGPYFVKPEEDKHTLAQALFEDREEQEIYKAQLDLAKDPEWPFFKH